MLLSPLALALVPSLPAAQELPEYEQQILFKVRAGVSFEELGGHLAELGLEGVPRRAFSPVPGHMTDRVGLGNVHVLEVAHEARSAALARLAGADWLVWAEPNSGGHALSGRAWTGTGPVLPDDPLFPQQWTLEQPSDFDMDVPEAWALLDDHALTTVRVAVLDTGILLDPLYPDLLGLPWTNAGEAANNGLDDDGNGYVDDVIGYDFVRDDDDPEDEHGHGTAVTSILAGHTNNGLDMAGVAANVEVIVVKVFNQDGDFPVSGPYTGQLSVAAGLKYAADQGALVINNSWGVDSGFSAMAHDAVQYALDNGVHVISGAGNNDGMEFYPAQIEGTIAVAGVDAFGFRSVWGFGSASNTGPWVDVSAGGSNVIGYYNSPGTLFLLNGTSMSTPLTAGVAAMLLSRFPALAQEDVRSLLMQSALSVDALNPGYAGLLGAGHVNAAAALQLLEPVTDLGQGLAGATTPRLHAWGAAGAGDTFTASVSAAAPQSPGALVLGTGQLQLPLFGGVLLPTPDVLLTFVTDAEGAWRLDATLVGGLPPGVTLYLQAGALDLGAAEGVAFSNAVSFTVN